MQETAHWEAVHEHAYCRLRRTAARLVSSQDAEDLVQDTFVKALQGQEGFRSDAAVTTWLHRILVNVSFDRLRQRKRRGTHVAIDHWTDAGWSRDLADVCALRAAWESLTPRQRAVSYLHDVAGYTHDEIARRLHICPGNSKSTLFDARRKLKRRLTGA
jgi:RNA polymerase sigma-70 factor (ECF subfamily)